MVQKVKLAILHAGDNLMSISATVANLNFDQRSDGSGFPFRFIPAEDPEGTGPGYNPQPSVGD